MSRALSVAESLAARIAALRAGALPVDVRERAEAVWLDVVGLCFAARGSDYVRSTIAAIDGGGPCTAIGHASMFRAEDAAIVNGTAAHGEDFDDTFEGGPVHTGAVIVPAVLAACERFSRGADSALVGTVAGVETMCRLADVRPKAIHDAGFHPTAVLGAIGATCAVGATLALPPARIVDAIGVAASFAGGVIEYLAEGAWTKRLHAGWAASAGLRAARLGGASFVGPRTALEGRHGLFNGFARDASGDYASLAADFGDDWRILRLAFKPYATGTMNQPYVDCALRLAARGIDAGDVVDVVCETADGYVPRLWEPLADKQRPANAYAAKFSTPFNIAVAFVTGGAGLGAFTEQTVRDPRVIALASKTRYVIDTDNPYPREYTGHVKMTLANGTVVEERQPFIRGGIHAPLARAELERKFVDNVVHGGGSASQASALLAHVPTMLRERIDTAPLRVAATD